MIDIETAGARQRGPADAWWMRGRWPQLARRAGRVSAGMLLAVAAWSTGGCSGILESGDHVTLEVAEGVVPCTGVASGECLLVRQPGDSEFRLFHGRITGFQLEAGYRYRLRVSRHTVAWPSADGSSVEWRLVRVESKQRSPRWAELQHMREQASLWLQERPAEYDLVVSVLCYCDPGFQGPVRLEVRADGPGQPEEATTRIYTENGAPVPAALWPFFPTVEGLFGRILRAAATDAHVLDVDYDPGLGYPRRVHVDRRQHVADDEVEYRVLELVPR